MQELFPIITGNMNYRVAVNAPSVTGNWVVSLGFSGIAEDTWGISGVNGKIYDNGGYHVGGYSSNKGTVISGSVFNSYHSIYQDGVLLSNTSQHDPNDYNMISVTSDSLQSYLPDVVVKGPNPLDANGQVLPQPVTGGNKKIFYATENAAADFGFVSTLSGMGFDVTSGNASGISGGYGIDDIYDLVILGTATTSGNYSNGAWNSLSTNIMSLNSYTVGSGNLEWFKYDSSGANLDRTGISVTGKPIWISDSTKTLATYHSPIKEITGIAKYYFPYNRLSYMGSPGSLGDDASYVIIDVQFGQPYSFTAWTPFEQEVFSSSAYVNESVGLTTGAGPLDIIRPEPSFNANTLSGHAGYKDNVVFRNTIANNGQSFLMYTEPTTTIAGAEGEVLVGDGGATNLINVFHRDTLMWTGDQSNRSRVSFSVTPSGLNWQTGYNMWGTLTSTGKRLFVNSVMGFF